MLSHLATTSECFQRDQLPNSTATAAGVNMKPYLWVTCILAYLNAITNGFSLIVFALDKKNVSMRRLLLLLSMSETVLNICMAANISVMLSVGSERHSFRGFTAPNLITSLFFLSFMLFNAYIMIRNWCLVLIAGSRCEVVRNPLSTRSGQIFSPSRTLLGYVVISLVSLGVYTPRMFEFTWIVYRIPCDEQLDANATLVEYLLTTRVHHKLDAKKAYGYYKTLLLFPLQTILPIFLIAGLSFLIIFTLRRRSIEQQHQNQGQTQARTSQDAATKTVMVLMVTFIICELPTFIFFVLNRTVFPALANFQSVRVHTTFIGNILVCMDSFSNFIIYSSTSNSFRDTARRIFGLPGGAKAQQGRARGLGNNYMALQPTQNLHRLSRASANVPSTAEAAAAETAAAAADACCQG